MPSGGADSPAATPRRRLPLAAALAVAVITAAALGVWHAAGDESATDPSASEQPADEQPAAEAEPAPSPPSAADPLAGGRADVSVGLVIGSDAQPGVDGERADVVLLALLAADDDVAPALVSLPRDLWVANPCTGGRSRLNAGLAGCGDEASGPELMVEMVEGVVGVGVDHRMVVDFAGFTEIVDAAGGVQVCVERPTRQRDLGLSLPAGCSQVGGDAALAWVRSRHTEERVDGQWRRGAGGDLERTRRQRDLAAQLVGSAFDVDDAAKIPELLDVVTAHAGTDVDVGFALGLADRLGGEAEVVTVAPRVEPHTTAGGAQVLELAEPVERAVARYHPALAELVW